MLTFETCWTPCQIFSNSLQVVYSDSVSLASLLFLDEVVTVANWDKTLIATSLLNPISRLLLSSYWSVVTETVNHVPLNIYVSITPLSFLTIIHQSWHEGYRDIKRAERTSMFVNLSETNDTELTVGAAGFLHILSLCVMWNGFLMVTIDYYWIISLFWVPLNSLGAFSSIFQFIVLVF